MLDSGDLEINAMFHRTVVSATLILVLAGTGLSAAEVEFLEQTTIVRVGDKYKIDFAVSGKIDVEVSIVDSQGKVVRHLAAGVLGAQIAPPAPLGPGLTQQVLWDGKDDVGQAVDGSAHGPFSVRVRLGTGVQFDGFLGENPFHFGAFWGMACDAEGSLYVLGASTGNRGPDGTTYLQVFNRQGEYVRTLMPMPADLSPEKAKAFDVIPTPDGHITPRNHRGTWPELYPGLKGGLSMSSRIGDNGIIWLTDGKRLARLATDGGGVGDTFVRFIWPTELTPNQTVDRWLMSWPSTLAISPDGQTVYLTGLYQTKPQGDDPLLFPPGRIYQAKADGSLMRMFVEISQPDGEPAHPTGITCDGEGNVLVCDRNAGRIVVFSPAGKQLGELNVVAPIAVAVHRTTGDVYVLSAEPRGNYRARKHSVKFAGWQSDAKEQARIELSEEGRNAVMALDDSAAPAVVWVGMDRAKEGDAWRLRTRAQVVRLEDRGDQFAVTDHKIEFADLPMGVVTRLAVHPETDVLVCRGEYAHAAVYDGLTGKRIEAPFDYAVDMGVGLDGHFYIQTGYGWNGPLCKFDGHLRAVPVPGERKPDNAVLSKVFGRYGNGFGVGGFTADSEGRLYVAQQLDHQTISGDCVVAFGPDGQAEDHSRLKDHPRFQGHGLFSGAIVGPVDTKIGNVAVDHQGYIYVGLRGQPLDHVPPPGFEEDPAYGWVVGSVVKIKPEGGSVFQLGGPEARPPRKALPVPVGMDGVTLIQREGYPRGPMFAENAVKVYLGLGSMSGGFGVGCRCRQPMFCLDPWGRLYLPNAITYTVSVLDNNGNVITRFGRYGNADSRGPGQDSLIKTPDIPLGWPEAVGVSQKAVYVADVLNRRIVRLRKTYAAERTCRIQ